MSHGKLRSGEVAGTYHVIDVVTEGELLQIAQRLARRRLARGRKLTQPALAIEYLQILMQEVEYEVFSALFLDSQHRVICFKQLFRGTINSASVYPREVVKEALACNAADVILVHNHPSGDPEPSNADQLITQRLQEALGLMEIRVIDHIIVGSEGCTSFAKMGYL